MQETQELKRLRKPKYPQCQSVWKKKRNTGTQISHLEMIFLSSLRQQVQVGWFPGTFLYHWKKWSSTFAGHHLFLLYGKWKRGTHEIAFIILSYTYHTFFDQTMLSSLHTKMSFDLSSLHHSSINPFLSWMEMSIEQDQWFNPSLLTVKWPEIAFKKINFRLTPTTIFSSSVTNAVNRHEILSAFQEFQQLQCSSEFHRLSCL